ncbi:hypothetical protein EDC02_5654 [Micromonospora sp. Llam0]|uniref:hypothetical protein n=1 Tax=Micromonospora sp. Llam0 TaxID=2485143 RepID=UPI000FBA6923|nr:hypothetical protein [Micromonospora sp. Llam0]ROO50796.1 hypothetical protein EDC02_5654 [Micromonospora sp. Llam0]
MRIAITGHRGLNDEVTAKVTETLNMRLSEVKEKIVGLTCLADGADQLFAEAVLRHGGQLEVVVPAQEYRDGLPEHAHATYDRLISQAVTLHRCDYRISDSTAHMAASELMVDQSDRLFAVWDGMPARSYGGTADVVAYAEARGIPVTVIWPPGTHRD